MDTKLLKADISFEVSDETGNFAFIVDTYTSDFKMAKSLFQEIKSKCELSEEFKPGIWSISLNFNESEFPHAFHSDYIFINVTYAIAELERIRNNPDFIRGSYSNKLIKQW